MAVSILILPQKASEVVACLLSAIGNGSDVCWDLAQLGAFLLQALVYTWSASRCSAWLPRARTHLPDELLHCLVQAIVGEVELGGDALCLLCESHAALRVGVEGAFELDDLLGFGADWGFVEEDGVAEGKAWGGDVPMVVLGEEAQDWDRVREVGYEDLEEKR